MANGRQQIGCLKTKQTAVARQFSRMDSETRNAQVGAWNVILINAIDHIFKEKQEYSAWVIGGEGGSKCVCVCVCVCVCCLLYTSPSPRDRLVSRMPSSA